MLWLICLMLLPGISGAQFTYITPGGGAVEITGCPGCAGDLTVPGWIDGLPVRIIRDYAFQQLTGLTSVDLPDTLHGIMRYAFAGCTHLSSVTLRHGLEYIDYAAFAGCTNLASLTLPDTVDWLGSGALAGTRLSSVNIPAGVRLITEFTFAGCACLTNVTLHNSVTSIDGSAFRGCSSLPTFTIPRSVTNIGDFAFQFCTSLPAITVDPLNPAYVSVNGVVLSSNQTTLVQYPAGRAGNYTIPTSVRTIRSTAFSGCPGLITISIPDTVINLGSSTFQQCTNLVNVTLGNGLGSIPDAAFRGCGMLTNVIIGSAVRTIGTAAFDQCSELRSIVIPASVTSIGPQAFAGCTNLTAVHFQGNAPWLGANVFQYDTNAVVYYLPGTTGWGSTFGGLPALLWSMPTIEQGPLSQTAEAGSDVGLCVRAKSSLPTTYFWRFNVTNILGRFTNPWLLLNHVQSPQAGAYTLIVSNAAGAVLSPPAWLQVIAPVTRRSVPLLELRGEIGTLLDVYYAATPSLSSPWITLASVSLTNSPQYLFDLTTPLPPWRFYRIWPEGIPATKPSVKVSSLIPAITLTGNPGDSFRIDYTLQFGPVDRWVTLATITLTNSSQLYFDVSAAGQPPRLYRLTPIP